MEVPAEILAEPTSQELLRYGILCNEATIAKGSSIEVQGDPVDTAQIKAAGASGLDIEQICKDYPRTGFIPFSSERKMTTAMHAIDGHQVAIPKGAPET
jgi:Ca2+-transporting ATPase